MSYRIDGVMTYWGGKSLSDPLVPPSEGVMEAMGRLLAKELTKYELEMKEKKTKKMTKAEAFEWLKCKKVNASGCQSAIQQKLFDIGCKWIDGSTEVMDFGYRYYIYDNGKFSFGGDDKYFRLHIYDEVKAEDILSLEIEEEKCGSQCSESSWEEIGRIGAKISAILRGINGHYHVEITEDSVNLYAEGVNLYYSDPF